MSGHDTLTTLRTICGAMQNKAPASGGLFTSFVADVESGGPISQIVYDHCEAASPQDFVKAFSSLGYLYESELVPELNRNFDALRGSDDDAALARAWKACEEALDAHPQVLLASLDRPVQHHLPRQAGKLLQGLGMLGAPRIRLLELGAIAGLNLHVDEYWWFGNGWTWGTEGSPVRLPAPGPQPQPFTIVERAGCDAAPRDPSDAEDLRIMRSFLAYDWELDRLEFDETADLTARLPRRVQQGDPVRWLRQVLAAPVNRSVTTVVWDNQFCGFLDDELQEEIREVLSRASRRMPLARLSLDAMHWRMEPQLNVTVYS